MGRKSLAKERRAHLLDAFERCIVQFGLEGTSLEQVAEEAQMTRSIIRHYIGNRDDLVNALIDRTIQQYGAQLEAEYARIAPDKRIAYLLDSLFTPKDAPSQHERIIVTVLMTAQGRYPQAKRKLVGLFEAIIQSIADDLHAHYPQAQAERCYQVAYGLLCLSEMHESFMHLGLKQRHHSAARQVATTLLRTLE